MCCRTGWGLEGIKEGFWATEPNPAGLGPNNDGIFEAFNGTDDTWAGLLSIGAEEF